MNTNVRVIISHSRIDFEQQVQTALESGFTIFPESFKVGINREGTLFVYSILSVKKFS
jgi:hypothetical protein